MAKAKRGRGRPEGSVGPGSVSIQIRVSARVAAILRKIGEEREDCRYGGQPSPAKAVAWLAERYAAGSSSAPG